MDLDYYEIVSRIAIDVLACLGPGYDEYIYQKAIIHELADAGISFESEREIPITYKGRYVGRVRADLVLDNTFVIELKACVTPPKDAEIQCKQYMRLLGIQSGMVINFPQRMDAPLYIARVG